MNVIYIGQNVLNDPTSVNYGGMIRKYYSQKVISENGNIVFINKIADLLKLKCCFANNDYFLWVHYPLRLKLAIVAIILSFLFRKKLILIVHDLPILQRRDLSGTDYHVLKSCIHKVIQSILFKLAKFLVLCAPDLENYFSKKKDTILIVMPPGVSQKDIIIASAQNVNKRKKVAIYFGSMKRGDSISSLTNIFTNINTWELYLVGPLDAEPLQDSKNIKYLGQLNHDKSLDLLYHSDVILIPYPDTEYFNLCMPIKLGYSLISCKPIIASNLDGIKKYINYVGLTENIIYIEKWDENTLKEALEKSASINIDKHNTLEKMSLLIWEKRFQKLIDIISDEKEHNYKKAIWL